MKKHIAIILLSLVGLNLSAAREEYAATAPVEVARRSVKAAHAAIKKGDMAALERLEKSIPSAENRRKAKQLRSKPLQNNFHDRVQYFSLYYPPNFKGSMSVPS